MPASVPANRGELERAKDMKLRQGSLTSDFCVLAEFADGWLYLIQVRLGIAVAFHKWLIWPKFLIHMRDSHNGTVAHMKTFGQYEVRRQSVQ